MLVQPRVWLSVPRDRQTTPGRLRVSAAHSEWNHVGIALGAISEAFFAADGIDELELLAFPESNDLLDREALQIDLLAKGAVDVAIDPRTAFILEEKSKGKEVCIVAARRKTHAFVLLGERGLRTIQDLRGTTLYSNHPGGATDVMMRQVLADSGIDSEKDVRIEYTGGAMHDMRGVTQLFAEGRYGPAALLTAVEMEDLVAAGYPVLADLRTMYPSRHDRVTAANERFAAENPDLLGGTRNDADS